jgi:drug/metabolite transporter (DMT)-like permease
MTGQRLAIRLMIAQAALFAAETAIIHQIGAQASALQLAFVRGASGVVLALVLAPGTGFSVMRTRQPVLQLVRGGVAFLYLLAMIYSFGHLPFVDATAISYTQVLYIALFSVLILGETVSGLHWVAAVIGIAGALLISKPSLSGWTSAYFLALVATSLNGLAFVLNRYLQREDSEATTMFYTNLVPAIGSLPALVWAARPAASTLVWLPALAFLGPMGVYCGIAAARHSSAATLGPYTLLRLVIALSAGIVIFHEMPGVMSAVGASLILGSCFLSAVDANNAYSAWLWVVRFSKFAPLAAANQRK